MSDAITIARPYAKAAFQAAIADDTLSQWSAFLSVAQQLTLHPDVVQVLKTPNVKMAEVVDLYEEVCDVPADSPFVNFLKLLAEYRRFLVLPEVAYLFEELRQTYEKQLTVDVQSAMPLDDAQQDKLKQALTKRLQRKVMLNCALDESLIGGIVVRAGGLVFDSSVKQQLRKLSNAMVNVA